MPEEYGGGGSTTFGSTRSSWRNFPNSAPRPPPEPAERHRPYFASLATDEQKQRWLPGYLSGELIGAMVMTEPGAGSDLGGIKTSAVRDGDDWMGNGSKTFISAGINGDLVIVVAAPIPRPATRASRCWWSRARRQPARPGG